MLARQVLYQLSHSTNPSFFETGSPCVAQIVLKLLIVLHQTLLRLLFFLQS
jgi:hypothetical protein